MLVCAYGFGLVGGALYAGRDGGDLLLRRRRSLALALLAAGMLACALAPVLWVALLTFVVTGTANGLFTTSNRRSCNARSPSPSTAAPSASSTRSTPGASPSRSWRAARSPPPSAAARPSRSPESSSPPSLSSTPKRPGGLSSLYLHDDAAAPHQTAFRSLNVT